MSKKIKHYHMKLPAHMTRYWSLQYFSDTFTALVYPQIPEQSKWTQKWDNFYWLRTWCKGRTNFFMGQTHRTSQ